MVVLFNKDKLVTYLIAVISVCFMFCFINISTDNIVQTSAKVTKELPIYNVQTEEKKVALTFDCAWSADDMEQILQILEENNVKATFFIVGTWIDKYPEVVKQISEKGHDVANHSDTHAHVANITYQKNVEEIQNCANKIETITGKKSTLYRGPYGEYNDTVLKAANDEGHMTIQWNIDTLDWKDLTANEMIDRISKKIEPGSIILLHNGTTHTADSLQGIIDYIKKQGYEMVKVSDLIYTENYYINNEGKQISN